jgi:hypothetical protein
LIILQRKEEELVKNELDVNDIGSMLIILVKVGRPVPDLPTVLSKELSFFG